MSLQFSLNQRCEDLFSGHSSRLAELGIDLQRGPGGSRLMDFGTQTSGTLAGGVLLAQLCLADLGSVSIIPFCSDPTFMIPQLVVQTSHPLAACMAGQFAGWPISGEGWFGMGSGPGRIHRGKEPFFERYPFVDESGLAWVIAESASLPGESAIRMMAAECGVPLEKLRVCAARTASLAGSIQIVARSLETTLHKLFELEFDLRTVVAGTGSAPLPPVGHDDIQSIGWTNDSILYGSRVWLCVDCDQQQVDSVIAKVPSAASSDFGRPFAEIFERYHRDFYAIDKMLFSPAQLTMHNLRSGITVAVGELRLDLLRESFGIRTGPARTNNS